MPNIKDDTWPYNVSTMTEDETTYAWTVATIHADSDRFEKYKVAFKEDTARETGKDGNEYRPYWELKGDWPTEVGGRPLPYAGEKYPPGTVVKVQLSIRKWVSSTGAKGESREILMPKKDREGNISKKFIEVYDGQTEQTPSEESQEEYPIRPVPTEGYVDKWELKDINIRKSQGLNVLGAVLRIPNQERMLKVLQAMGFKDFDEANEAHGYGYSLLRRGKPVELPVAVSDMEEEVEEDSPMVEAAVEAGAVKQDENVEQLKW